MNINQLVLKDMTMLENILFSTNNIEYNFEHWKSSLNGKLFVTGYTGSGKSTLSEKLSKNYNATFINLDVFITIDKDHVAKLKQNNKIKELKQYYQKVTDDTISKLLKDNRKLVIEGIQVFLYSNINKLKSHSVIILGTSTLKSAYRAYFRNRQEDWNKNWSWLDTIFDIYHNLFISKVESFIKLVKSWKKIT